MKIAVRFLTIVFLVFLFSLFTIHLSLTTPFAYAVDPPNPKPCENALDTDNRTKNVLDPISFPVTASGASGEQVYTAEKTFSINVDFSKLQAVFGSVNSNYLESRFQDETHRNVNIVGLESKDFNLYHGPGQKAAPRAMTDKLRVEYVNYIYNKPTLAEADNQYRDFEGENPATIYELVTSGDPNFRLPDLDPDTDNPTPPSWGGDKDVWQDGWAKYWEKIPTAVSEFYYGILRFEPVAGQSQIQQAENGQLNQCPISLRDIYFVMPEFFRTTSVSNQLNQITVPKAAQSYQENLLASAIDGTKNFLSKAVSTCLKSLSQTPLSKTLKKAVKVTFDFLKPIKIAYADDLCPLKILPDSKSGNDPFCALPPLNPEDGTPQLQAGDRCVNVDDPNKLDQTNPNVNCTFQITFSSIPRVIPDEFDSCQDPDGDGIFDCILQVKVWPVFYIPWLAEIWNNTTYSNKEDEAYIHGDLEQKTGRPGVYTLFKPKAVDPVVFPKEKNLPGKTQKSAPSDLKERFIGAADCNKFFTRDIALKPKALQEANGIQSNECDLLAAVPPGPSPGPGPGPGPGSDCGKYDADNSPQGNFGDPDCDFSPEALALYLLSLDPAEAYKYYNIAFVEGGYSFQPNAYNPAASNGTAWGLFQMDERDNGPYDQGHVRWREQADNAVHYNDDLPPSERWCYWGAAYLDYLGYCPRWLSDL